MRGREFLMKDSYSFDINEENFNLILEDLRKEYSAGEDAGMIKTVWYGFVSGIFLLLSYVIFNFMRYTECRQPSVCPKLCCILVIIYKMV